MTMVFQAKSMTDQSLYKEEATIWAAVWPTRDRPLLTDSRYWQH